MSECHSECDCGTINGHPHEPDCHWWDKCDERLCDRHEAEQMAEHKRGWLNAGGSTYAATEDQMRRDMIDAGRGHLLPDVLADKIDMARMRAKEQT